MEIHRPKLGVVGLWHLGSVIAASWAKLGYRIVGVDFDDRRISLLQQGIPPLFEPGLQEIFQEFLKKGRLAFSADASRLLDCPYVFFAFDTPVDDEDNPSVTPLEEAILKITPYLSQGTIVIVSAQLPVGTARRFRAQLKEMNSTIDLAYVPENLRLGEALNCYLDPGRLIIGADDDNTVKKVGELFRMIPSQPLFMNLPSAEMTKHGINAFLALSICFANQLSGLCRSTGADYSKVQEGLRGEPRIGQKAYLSPGIGFSGGTLGRDLRALEEINQSLGAGQAPLFKSVWTYNQNRPEIVIEEARRHLGDLEKKRVTLWGLTYKPGTSTLRRSIPLRIAKNLIERGTDVCVFDPKADWEEFPLPQEMEISRNIIQSASAADMIIVLTEWPEFLSVDYAAIRKAVRNPLLFDPKNFLKSDTSRLEGLGFRIVTL